MTSQPPTDASRHYHVPIWLVALLAAAVILLTIVVIGLAAQPDRTSEVPATTDKAAPTASSIACEPDRSGSITLSKCLGLAPGGALPELDAEELSAVLHRFDNVRYGVLRYDWQWRFIQPLPTGSLYWGPFDTVAQAVVIYNQSRSADRRVITQAVLDFAPGWANPKAGVNCAEQLCGPDIEHTEAFGKFGASVVRHFKNLGLPFQIEGWNEQNQDRWFAPRPNPQIFSAMMHALNREVKAIDAAIPVIMGGLAHVDGDGLTPPEFMNAFYAAGGKSSFDLASVHPYDGSLVETAAVHQIMADNGEGHKKIQVSEVGFKTATELQKFLDLWFAQPWAAGVLIYSPTNDDADTSPWLASGENKPETFSVWRDSLLHQGQWVG